MFMQICLTFFPEYGRQVHRKNLTLIGWNVVKRKQDQDEISNVQYLPHLKADIV